MEEKFALYPIPGVASPWLDESFDDSVLPAQLIPGVTVEDTETFFQGDPFSWVKGCLSKREISALEGVKYAIVYRYHSDERNVDHQEDIHAEALVRNLAACLRLIRPMRQRASFISGKFLPNSQIEIHRFENPQDQIEVPAVQKLFYLRNRDLERLQKVSTEFLRAMQGEYWKFKIATELHESGYFSHAFWKARFSLWCSALEALFTSLPYDHRGTMVATERIRWFVGPSTCIYAPGDIQSIEADPGLTVDDVIDDLYELRNNVAHGSKIPPKFFAVKRTEYGEDVVLAEVLNEAASFVIRTSLLRILEDRLLGHFADGPSSEVFFAANGLTRPAIKAKTNPAVRSGTP